MTKQPSVQPRRALDWTPPRRQGPWRRTAVAAVTSAAVAVGGFAAAQPAAATQPSVFLDTIDTWDAATPADEAAQDAAEGRAVQLAAQVMADAEIARAERAAAKKAAAKKAAAEKAAKEAAARRSLPLKKGTYTVGSLFGATGSWARYHTGVDFVAGQGTRVYAVVPGTVVATTAGAWAGIHVAIQASDGSSTLYAHLSGTEVQVGDTVEAGELVGYVGETGRAFGAHLHFEYYPVGATPGDIYTAADPRAYLESLGLKL